MDLKDYLGILRARWILITVITLLGVIAAATASMLATPMYQSCTTQFVKAGNDQDVQTAWTGSLFSQQRVKSYVEAVTSTDVMNGVVDDLNIDGLTAAQVKAGLEISNPLDTVLLNICSTDADPAQARDIATSTATQFKGYVDNVLEGSNGKSFVTISQLSDATLPTSPVTPRTKINIALGFLVGLAIGVGVAVLLETLDTRIKSIDVLTKHFKQPLLGIIGYEANATKRPLIVQDPSQSKRSESFRQVRTNLQFVDVDHRPRSIVVTSSMPREGKSTTAINLAITIAQTGQPVFLIEGDLRRPMVAEYLGVEGAAGLTDVLVGRATIDEVVQPWGNTGNLWVLSAGTLPPNPSELLGSQAMADLIHHLEKRATLIIDAPPLLPVTDAAVLTKLSGGAILVVRAGKTRREQLRTAESSIESVGGRVLGLVLNMAPAKGPDSYRYGYGYQYDYSNPAAKGHIGEHPPVIPAGLGGLPGVNGSSTPVTPIGDVPRPGAPEPEVEKPVAQSAGVKGTDHEINGALPDVAPAGDSPLKQVPGVERVIGHSMRVPLPPPTVDEPIQAFEPDPEATDAWTPPKPRPAFDPLTAPLDDVEGSF